MGNPDPLIDPDEIAWLPPDPATRVEPYESWVRRARTARTRRTDDVAAQPSPSRPTDAVVSVAAGLAKGALGFQVVLVATVAAGRFWFGGPAMMITGGSMEPAIPVGSVVLTEPTTDIGPLPGAIVSFDVDGHTVTHRVVARDGDELITRGDANRTDDSTPVMVDDVVGAAELVVPYVGLPHLWSQSGDWTSLAIWGAANLLGVATIRYDARRARSVVTRRHHRRSTSRPTTVRTRVAHQMPVRSVTVRTHQTDRDRVAGGWALQVPANLGS